MATNLNIENLSRIVQVGDVDALMGSRGDMQVGAARVSREMQANGMDAAGGESAVHQAGGSFSKMLTDSIDKVNEAQVQSDTAIKELVAGRSKNIHETMLTIEKADTSLKLLMQVRNKVLDAYREVMRMQV